MKRSFLILGLSLAMLLATLAVTIQAGPPSQESRPPCPMEGVPEDLPLLESARTEPEAQMEPAAPNSIAGWSKLVFQSYRDGNWEIFRANGDGSGETRLTYHDASDIYPRLNRGCNRIAFVSNRHGNYKVFTMNLNGSGLARLTNTGANEYSPAWSRDGTRIVFNSYRDGQSEIYVMNADGSGQTRLTWHDAYDGMPVWAPDGARIAFVSDRAGDSRVWVMNADGSGQAQLSSQPTSQHPAWSPDGSLIAYDADGNSDGWQELWLMNADGTDQHVEYDPPELETDAWAQSWSPEGRCVAFTRISFVYYQGNWYWTRAYLDAWDLEANHHVRLSHTGVDWYPDWQTTDITPPTSHVHALPAQSPSPFAVHWSSSDTGGAGVRDLEFQVRDGADGVWTDWIPSVDPPPQYAGVGWHTYYFRCRATDYAGNVEP